MKRGIAILLVASLFITFSAPFTLAQDTAYQRGYEEGKRAANQDTKIVGSLIESLWGFLLGPVPVLYSLIFDSKVPARRLQRINHRSRDYREGFEDGYKERVERSTLLSRIGGWAGWIAVWAVAFSSS